MANFYDIVLTVLRKDKRFVAEDGTFLRNAVYEAAMKMDEKLIRLLLTNEVTIAITKNISSNRKSGTSFYNRQQIQT